MTQARRQSCESETYHLVARGVGRMNIFEDDDDRAEFLRILGEAFKARQIGVYAWCLMSNHVHLLVHGSLEEISSAMKGALGFYARLFNEKHDHVGHLFQGRFTSVPVLDDAQLLEVVRYIHQNPSSAGVGECSEYPWSSYGLYVADGQAGKPSLPLSCETDFVLEVLGGREEFVRFHSECGEVDFEKEQSRARSILSETAARNRAEDVLGADRLATLPSLGKAERDCALCQLKEAGLSVRHIERITGIGRNIIQRATTPE